MGISQVVVTAITLVIVMAILTSAVGFLIPINSKLKFDNICRNYLLISESENGLSNEMVENLEKELENLGLKEIEIEASDIGSIKRGEKHRLYIKAIKESIRLSMDLTREIKKDTFIFDRFFVARRIIN